MRIYDGLDELKPLLFNSPSLTVGVFDGFHLGHRFLIERLLDESDKTGGDSVVFTFRTHPKSVLTSNTPTSIMSFPHRLLYLRRAGVDACIVVDFNREFASITAEQFVEEILIKRVGIRTLVLGFDSVFGKDRNGNADFVRKNYPSIKVVAVNVVKLNGLTISSSLIRRMIIEGRIEDAARLLGHPVSVYGEVVRGSGRGISLGYPTTNLIPENETLPPSGVYASKTILEDGSRYLSVTNIGVRPTFSDSGRTVVEVHILDFKGSLYGERIEVELHKFIRKERKFSSNDALISQIENDIQRIRTDYRHND